MAQLSTDPRLLFLGDTHDCFVTIGELVVTREMLERRSTRPVRSGRAVGRDR
jgi:hypothetical protein